MRPVLVAVCAAAAPLPAPGLAPRELLAKAASFLPSAGGPRAQTAVTRLSWRTTPQTSEDETRGQGPRGAQHSQKNTRTFKCKSHQATLEVSSPSSVTVTH